MKKTLFTLLIICLSFIFVSCNPSGNSDIPAGDMDSLVKNKEIKIPREVNKTASAVIAYQKAEEKESSFKVDSEIIYQKIKDIFQSATNEYVELYPIVKDGLAIQKVDENIYSLQCDNLVITNDISISMDFDSARYNASKATIEGKVEINYMNDALSIEFDGSIPASTLNEGTWCVKGIEKLQPNPLDSDDDNTMWLFERMSSYIGSDYGWAYDFMAILSGYNGQVESYNKNGIKATISADGLKLSFDGYNSIIGCIDFLYELKNDIPVIKLVTKDFNVGDKKFSTDGLYVFYNIPIGGNITIDGKNFDFDEINGINELRNKMKYYYPLETLINEVYKVVGDVLADFFRNNIGSVSDKIIYPLGSKSMVYHFDKISFENNSTYPTIDKTIWCRDFNAPFSKIDSIHITSKSSLKKGASEFISDGKTGLFIADGTNGAAFLDNKYVKIDL